MDFFLKRCHKLVFVCSTISSYNIRYRDWEKTGLKGVLLKKIFASFVTSKVWRFSGFPHIYRLARVQLVEQTRDVKSRTRARAFLCYARTCREFTRGKGEGERGKQSRWTVYTFNYLRRHARVIPYKYRCFTEDSAKIRKGWVCLKKGSVYWIKPN